VSDHRPDPDVLLERIRHDEAQRSRGRLKLFFGACAGVGKTYSMLEAARVRARDGANIVVGWSETHGRAETEALLEGLEVLPRRKLSYRGIALEEFDLDAALERRPAVILVDELAHSNAPGSRHAKRWRDVEELLAAGTDVWSTVNVQHVESLNDVVARITGVHVRETIPDHVFDLADDIELVDIPPEELLQRLHEGKVYVSEDIGTAADNFFRKGNLIALRELALRRTADRVDAQMVRYRQEHAIGASWPTAGRLLVLVGPSPYANRLVRATRRLAADLRAKWIALHVETPDEHRLPDNDREQLGRTLALAEQLGGEVTSVSGADVAEEALAYARRRNVSAIVIGRPPGRSHRRGLAGTLADRLLAGSGGLDVFVVSTEPVETPPASPRARLIETPRAAWMVAAAIVLACTLLAVALRAVLAPENLVMIYLVGVMVVAVRCGREPAIAASLISVAAFDFFCVPPYLTFRVADTQYLFTFGVMLAAALLISGMASRIRLQAETERLRERRTAALYAMARDFAAATEEDGLAAAAARHVAETLDANAAVLLPTGQEGLRPRAIHGNPWDIDDNEFSVATWVFEHGQAAGAGTETLPGASALYVPLVASKGVVGAIGVATGRRLAAEQKRLLEAFANQTANAIERVALAREAREAALQVEAETFRNTLLASVSHDLRTPLTTIAGASASLLDPQLDRATHDEMVRTVLGESERLNRLIGNILQVTRLERGKVEIEKQWQPIEEALGAALSRLEEELGDRPVVVDLPPDLPLVEADGLLLEQLFHNLLDNAARHTPAATAIRVSAHTEAGWLVVEIRDEGPGLPPGSESKVFDRFYRSSAARGRGSGLGLSICRAIVVAHGGNIWARSARAGGAVIGFRLPLGGAPPVFEAKEGEGPEKL
jgi:two-component system sensor histidine kinase KdpD